jgi:hypothetical protein
MVMWRSRDAASTSALRKRKPYDSTIDNDSSSVAYTASRKLGTCEAIPK